MTNEELVAAIQQSEEPSELLGQLYQQNHGLIYRYVKRYGGLADVEELMQEAFFAVHNAAMGYEPEKGAFTTYLIWHLKGHIGRFVVGQKASIRLPENRIWQILSYREYVSEYEGLHGQKPSPRTIRQHMGLTCEKFDELLKDVVLTTLSSLDEPLADDLDSTLGEVTASEGDIESDYLERDELERLSVAVHSAVEKLPQEEQAVIRARYFDGLTFLQTAASVGISPGLAQRRCNRGLDHLRFSADLKDYREEMMAQSAGVWSSVGFFKNHGMSGVEYAVDKILNYENGIERRKNINRSVNVLNALDDIQKLIQQKAQI